MNARATRTIAIFLVSFLLLGLGQVSGVGAVSPILYVAPGGACVGTPNCFPTVQAAVEAASPGNEIRVAEGTYTDLTDCPRNDVVTTGVAPAVVCLDKTVSIRGGWNVQFNSHNPDTHPTFLDAGGLGRVLYITGTISPTVEDLVITHGNASGLGGYAYYGTYDVGGGVYIMNANATLRNNWIDHNSASKGGGGVYIGQSNSQLNYNIIENNSAVTDGAGAGVMIYKGSPSLTGNSLSLNTSSNIGGGVYVFDSDATFTYNMIYHNTTPMYGGGIDVASCDPTLDRNIFRENSASEGGGVYLWYSQSLLTNNVFINNTATTWGSALSIGGSQPVLVHTTIAHNTGGDGSAVHITNDNGSVNSTVFMTNSILSSQATSVYVDSGSVLNMDGVLWFDNVENTGGAGTINLLHSFTGNPAFEPADGYHLTSASAAIDQGVSTDVLYDIDNQRRSPLPDLGADEYWPAGQPHSLYLPLVRR